MNRWLLVPYLLVTASYAAVAPNAWLAGALAAIAVPALFLPGVVASRSAQWVAHLVVGAGALALLVAVLPAEKQVITGVLRTGTARFAALALTLAAFRMYLERPAGGPLATLAVLLVALTACGGTATGWVFPTAVAAFLVVAFTVRRAIDPARASWKRRTGRQWVATTGALALGGAIAGAWIASLPPMHDAFVRRLMGLIPHARTGFSDRLWLGSLRGMLQSDEIVLRLRGGSADYLRGTVYDRYVGGRWTTTREVIGAPRALPPSLPAGTDVRNVEFVGDETDFYFLPLDTGAVAAETGIATIEPAGTVRPIAASVSERISFRVGPRTEYPIVEPSALDLQMPRALFQRIGPLAREWTRDAASPRAKLEALERRLQEDFRYSLEFERPGHEDPIEHFLFGDQQGHCEYFASALAMLARSVDVPTRVVGGYRVTERNTLGDYYIVRERNAHTWVEAWIPEEGWVTFDATPAAELQSTLRSETPVVAAVIDLIRSAWGSGLRRLDALSWTQLLVPLFALVLLFALVRWWRARTGGRSRRGDDDLEQLECFERLSEALAQRGRHRAATVPVELWARRLASDPNLGDLRKEAHDLLIRYSALRYGNLGEEAELSRDIERFVARLRTTRPAAEGA